MLWDLILRVLDRPLTTQDMLYNVGGSVGSDQNNTMENKNWEHFVNLYRQLYSTNDGLDDDGLRQMSETQMEREIQFMLAMLDKKSKGSLLPAGNY